MIKTIRRIISGLVWSLLTVVATLLVTLRLPAVQDWAGGKAAELLGEKLGTEVSIGRVDLGFLNRVILDDIIVYDQQHRQMLKATRLTTKVEIAPLAVGKVVVSSAQLFDAHLCLYKRSKDAPANFQFVVDSLTSKDTTSHTPLDLRINSFIMRHSSVSYDEWDAPKTSEQLNTKHLNVRDISAYIKLKALKNDSININVKRLTFIEQSGLNVRRLTFKLSGGSSGASLKDFHLQLPETDVGLDSLTATYHIDRLRESLCLRGNLTGTRLTPADFRCLLPVLKNYQHSLSLITTFNYQDNTLTVPSMQMKSLKGELNLQASGLLHHPQQGADTWQLRVNQLDIADEDIDFISKNFVALPSPVLRAGNVLLRGSFECNAEGTIHGIADVETDAGSANTQMELRKDKQFTGNVTTEGIDVGRLIDNPKIGLIAANVDMNGTIDKELAVKGRVDKLEYDGDAYTNIELDGSYSTNMLAGWLQINDPKVGARLEFDLNATSLNDAVGVVSLRNLSLPEKNYQLSFLKLESGFNEGRHFVTLNSDFAHANLSGEFDYSTLAQSIANAVGSKLPTLPGLPQFKPSNNNFALKLVLGKTDWLQKLFDIKLDVHKPVQLNTTVNDLTRQILVDMEAPDFTFGDNHYQGGTLHVNAPRDTMFLNATISKINGSMPPFDISIDGHAADNSISLALAWDNNNRQKPLSGVLNANSHLYHNFDDTPEAHINIQPSDVIIDNSTWHLEPADILYSTDRLLIDHFSVNNGEQSIEINGIASKQPTDSVVVGLHDVEVAYILDLVGFDAVSFSGKASGKAFLTSAFNNPDAYANLTVNDFKFEDGRMGVLSAHVDWNKTENQIDIHATTNDGPDATTFINGYVSPERNYIDLGISAHGTYLEFMHKYTKSFISSITGHGNGDLRLAGPLSAINLTGGLVVDGEATITPLNTTYWLRNDSITLVYNEIVLDSLPIYDKYENVAYLSGGIHHKDLTNLSLDLHVDTDKLLGYDFKDFGEQSFYGTVYAAGSVDITMKGDDVHINSSITPLKGSVFVYNAANPDAISSQEFITWIKTPKTLVQNSTSEDEKKSSDSSNIYMTFDVNATPDGTMRLLMDAKTGDYINLNGNGLLHATYYNKGAFEMQGTYTVESGTYDVTIQNIINKKFQFQPNGTIIFGGDPYAATLNLQALYTVNGVSLSDLQLGNSFSSNTVRVNCLMNIGGQPAAPQVTFDLEMPSVNADEQQMVRSLLSSQQEMNQQVLYLLGIGRFYSQGQNNAMQQQQGQTSLAMQSFLSGTLSTQINSVINQIVKNDDWNFGANISTGTEGWNNAEYEGIVNGKMLNNRLLLNGQFGYRDNATTATPSFIGDFDIRYLLYPNGNLALKVYNQTNDRYFTRSSLNTQGIGLIMKKDFNGLLDFFGIKKQQ